MARHYIEMDRSHQLCTYVNLLIKILPSAGIKFNRFDVGAKNCQHRFALSMLFAKIFNSVHQERPQSTASTPFFYVNLISSK